MSHSCSEQVPGFCKVRHGFKNKQTNNLCGVYQNTLKVVSPWLYRHRCRCRWAEALAGPGSRCLRKRCGPSDAWSSLLSHCPKLLQSCPCSQRRACCKTQHFVSTHSSPNHHPPAQCSLGAFLLSEDSVHTCRLCCNAAPSQRHCGLSKWQNCHILHRHSTSLEEKQNKL